LKQYSVQYKLGYLSFETAHVTIMISSRLAVDRLTLLTSSLRQRIVFKTAVLVWKCRHGVPY